MNDKAVNKYWPVNNRKVGRWQNGLRSGQHVGAGRRRAARGRWRGEDGARAGRGRGEDGARAGRAARGRSTSEPPHRLARGFARVLESAAYSAAKMLSAYVSVAVFSAASDSRRFSNSERFGDSKISPDALRHSIC